MSDQEEVRTPDGELLEKAEHRTKEPEMYKVIIHNDHYTPRIFVVEILVTVFRKSTPDATGIMMTAHRSGKALVGVYTLDIARTKVAKARTLAKENDFPLRFTVEGA